MATFSWASAADVGLGILGALGKQAGSAKLDAAKNGLRDAQNDVRRSAAGLAATMQSLNNQRLLRAAGDQQDAMTRTLLRTQDAAVAGQFEQSINNAEKLGAYAAQAASRGVGGSSVTMVGRAAEAAQARQRQYAEDAYASQTYEIGQAMAGLVPNALRSLNNTPSILQQDRTVTSTAGSLTSALIRGLFNKKDSLQTMLGSLADQTPTNNMGLPPVEDRAFSYPVTQSNVVPTEIVPVNTAPTASFDWNYDDLDRITNRSRTLGQI